MRYLLLIILTTLNFSCQLVGTETGNPAQVPHSDPCSGKSRCVPTPLVANMANVIADKIVECSADNPPNYADTFERVMDEPGLNLELPLPHTNFKDLFSDYNKKLIGVDDNSYNACMNELVNLSCTSPTFQNAFDVIAPTDFSKIHQILRVSASCQTTYFLKE